MFSGENNDVLDLVDQLRSQGINHYIDLPQIVVCGDQSSGKSSVLEAISGLQFPRKDNLCTRFATEVILRRSENVNSKASIVPAKDRSDHDRQKLAGFSRIELKAEDLEMLVEEARSVMAIDGDTKAFSDDVLRIELSGPSQPHLTLVDLPGLFSAGNKSQSDEDAQAVRTLVLSYMRNPRSIILAVVSAKNDFANQIVTKYTRDVDDQGTRTLGIITKPDTLDSGSDSERSYLVLAKNEDVHFRLGWHVLRNRDFDTRMVSSTQRDQIEDAFFAEGAWSSLAKNRVGVATLRPRLSHLLRQQILIELPNLITDIEEGLEDSTKGLSALGVSRATVAEQRLYLLRISQEFTFLVGCAVDGSYTDTFFGSAASMEGYRKRLRAVVQNKSIAFAKLMRERGHAKHIVETTTKKQTRSNPRLISKDDYITQVLTLMTRSRGTELPGTYSPLIVGDLFREQSEPWQALIHSFIIEIYDAVQATLRVILQHVADGNTAAGLQREILQPALEQLRLALEEAAAIVLDRSNKGHPITYNHYLTENIQKLREDRQAGVLSHKLDQFFGTNIAAGDTWCRDRSFDVKSLLRTLTQDSIADMDRYACAEATDVMRAYYKVALKQCIDDVAHNVERTLLGQLSQLLCPQTAMGLSDAMIDQIAAESADAQNQRVKLLQKQESLKIAHAALRALSVSSTIDGCVPPSPTADGVHEPISETPDMSEVEDDSCEPQVLRNLDEEPKERSSPDPENYISQHSTKVPGVSAHHNLSEEDLSSFMASLDSAQTSVPAKTAKKSKKKVRVLTADQQ